MSAFPEGFLWGTATAAHQIEGNNVNSDSWVLEHAKPSLFAEPSGDATDSYHRFAEDVDIVASLGLDAYWPEIFALGSLLVYVQANTSYISLPAPPRLQIVCGPTVELPPVAGPNCSPPQSS